MTLSVVISSALSVLYIVGGILHMRQLVMAAMVDELLYAMNSAQAGRERLHTRIMTAGAALTLASGLSLMAMSRWTVLILACNAILQGGFLIWAARTRPPEDAPERGGRAATLRALMLYLATLGLAIYLDYAQAWRAWLEPAILELGAITAVTLAAAVIILRRPGGRRPTTHQANRFSASSSAEPPPPPERLRLAPEFHCLPLWDDATGNMLVAEELGLSEALVARIHAWDGDFQALYRFDHPAGSCFDTVEAERAWVSEGETIAAEIRREWPGPVIVRISSLETLLKDARDPYNLPGWTGKARARWAGERCGVAEIRDAISRLDALARERDATPEWDGDTSDDIAEAQTYLKDVLTHAPPRYGEDIAGGLSSAQWLTRTYIAQALAERGDPAALAAMRQTRDQETDPAPRSIIAAAITRLEAQV